MEKFLSRVSVLIKNNNNFVLIFRHKNGEDYYAIPGGGIEAGESPQQAAFREIQEELGLTLKNIRQISKIITDSREDFIFFAETNETDFVVTGPEQKHLNDPNNLFKPIWLNKKTLNPGIPVYPEASRSIFINFLKNLD